MIPHSLSRRVECLFKKKLRMLGLPIEYDDIGFCADGLNFQIETATEALALLDEYKWAKEVEKAYGAKEGER